MNQTTERTSNAPIQDVALVLEGGGFRGIYTAGVLDAMMQQQLYFAYLIGVSAGAAYSVSYISHQYERNIAVNQYVNDKRYCSWGNLIKRGTYFNWEFMYRTIPTQIIPFDYNSFYQSSSHLKVVVTNTITGKAEYKELRTNQPDEFRDWLTATSSLPFIAQPKQINGQLYMDGGLSDSIPVQQALKDGNQRAVVVLTRPLGYRKKMMKNSWIIKQYYRKYPKLAECIVSRAQAYNHTLDELDQLEQAGKVFVIRPANTLVVSRLENNPDNLKRVYDDSLIQMKEVLPKLNKWLATKI
ncbi:patatin-like phospholipase family protein [Geofilum sp. OHC36d9]|uniref:patatin-like phospholipase family protein n=1 Tax=Geofilum sp. OHC36d9 TaxID=3458413 RepID=UPI0040340C3D